jgi:hypothetical protein
MSKIRSVIQKELWKNPNYRKKFQGKNNVKIGMILLKNLLEKEMIINVRCVKYIKTN